MFSRNYFLLFALPVMVIFAGAGCANETSLSTEPLAAACAEEYAPVCGDEAVVCVKAPCLSVRKTFSNRCFAEQVKAQDIADGVCPEDVQTGSGMIQVAMPVQNAVVVSPLAVNGEAKNEWFTKGKLFVAVMDSEGKVLGTGTAQAGDAGTVDGMTKFNGSIVFKSGTAKNGMAKFSPTAPGLPNNDSYIVQVRF